MKENKFIPIIDDGVTVYHDVEITYNHPMVIAKSVSQAAACLALEGDYEGVMFGKAKKVGGVWEIRGRV